MDIHCSINNYNKAPSETNLDLIEEVSIGPPQPDNEPDETATSQERATSSPCRLLKPHESQPH